MASQSRPVPTLRLISGFRSKADFRTDTLWAVTTKAIVFIAAALGLFLNAFGQVAPDYRSQVAGAVQVVSVTFDPVQQNVPYQVVLRNISPRIILAYEYTV